MATENSVTGVNKMPSPSPSSVTFPAEMATSENAVTGGVNETPSSVTIPATENAVTCGNKAPSTSSVTIPAKENAVSGGNKVPATSSVTIPAKENAVTGGNGATSPSSVTVSPGEKMKEIEAEIMKERADYAACAVALFICAFRYNRKKEKRQRIIAETCNVDTRTMADEGTGKNVAEKKLNDSELQNKETFKEDSRTMADKGTAKSAAGELQSKESLQTMTDMETEKKTDEKSNVLKRKRGDQQGEETFSEDVEPMTTAKNFKKDSAETSALTRSVQKLDQKGKEVSVLKCASSLPDEIDSQKSDSGKTKRNNVERAVKMIKAIRGPRSDDDDYYAIFRKHKGDFNDFCRKSLYQSGVLGSKEATGEGGKKETNTDCVIQSLAKRNIKVLQRDLLGSNAEFDPSDDVDVIIPKILVHMEHHMCELYRLYIAEELEKNKMVNNGADA